MSNCIDIGPEDVLHLRGDEIDLPAFKAAVESAVENSTAWWYLQQNCQFSEHSVSIYLSDGRSSHCWRSFKGTGMFISEFLKVPIHFRTTVKDEAWYRFRPLTLSLCPKKKGRDNVDIKHSGKQILIRWIK